MYLLHTVEKFLRRTNTPPIRFGREAMGDPRFVSDLRNGREPREITERRVRAYLRARDIGANA
jgi:2,4-dienoyl-CoA reductase-like NADH-dependent reductase (Old Yellow Enzyme family)